MEGGRCGERVSGPSPAIPACRTPVRSKDASGVGTAFNANPLNLSTWEPRWKTSKDPKLVRVRGKVKGEKA